eukprot:SAG31_NODE_516_length_14707_cov_3.026629_7_plen_277_part_00
MAVGLSGHLKEPARRSVEELGQRSRGDTTVLPTTEQEANFSTGGGQTQPPEDAREPQSVFAVPLHAGKGTVLMVLTVCLLTVCIGVWWGGLWSVHHAFLAAPGYIFWLLRIVAYLVLFSIIALVFVCIFFARPIVLKLVNTILFTSDPETGLPNGVLAERLRPHDLIFAFCGCRISIQRLRIRPQVLDDNVLDKFMGHLPWRCRSMELRELTIRWSFISAPRLQVVIDGFHIRLYGRWFDAATMVRDSNDLTCSHLLFYSLAALALDSLTSDSQEE